MKSFFISASIIVSIGLFALFIFKLQKHVASRPPGIVYSLGLQGRDNSIVVQIYQQSDTGVDKELHGKSGVQKTGENVSVKDEATRPYNEVVYGGRTIAFNSNPKLMLWILTFALMVAVSFSLLVGFCGHILMLLPKLTTMQRGFNIGFAFLFFVALCYFNLDGSDNRTFLPPFDIIYDLNVLFDRKVFNWIYPGEIFTFFVGGVAFCGILFINSFLGNQDTKLDKPSYQGLKADLDRYLAGFSILIVFAILTISFLNQALIGHFVNAEKLLIVRSEFIYAYGFVFSSLLALIYVPINQRLRSMTEPGVFDTGSEKNMFHNNFLSLLSILAPLASSGVTEMIKAMS